MSRLLYSGVVRTRKNKTFWCCIIGMVVLIVAVCLNQYYVKQNFHANVVFDKLFLSYALLTGFFLAIFSSLFLGTEYSDGTVRNKLIVGHSRYNIYLANFLCCAAAGLFFDVVFILVVSLVGVPMFGFFKADLWIVGILAGNGLLLTITYASFFTMMSMVISNRSVNGIVCLLIFFAGIILAGILLARLQEPEVIGGIVISSDGTQYVDGWTNPRYLKPEMRALYELIMDILPSGQSLTITDATAVHPFRMALFSMIEILFFTVLGMRLFEKKDLK